MKGDFDYMQKGKVKKDNPAIRGYRERVEQETPLRGSETTCDCPCHEEIFKKRYALHLEDSCRCQPKTEGYFKGQKCPLCGLKTKHKDACFHSKWKAMAEVEQEPTHKPFHCNKQDCVYIYPETCCNHCQPKTEGRECEKHTWAQGEKYIYCIYCQKVATIDDFNKSGSPKQDTWERFKEFFFEMEEDYNSDGGFSDWEYWEKRYMDFIRSELQNQRQEDVKYLKSQMKFRNLKGSVIEQGYDLAINDLDELDKE